MKWDETIATQCRYGDIAGRIWSDWEIIWEDSEADYQGHASIVATKDGKWALYEWWYGSCSGCDGWESDGKDEDEIEAEMRKDALWFDDFKAFCDWFTGLKGDFRSNADMNRGGGGMVFGLDLMSGGLKTRVAGMKDIAMAAGCAYISRQPKHEIICKKCKKYSDVELPHEMTPQETPEWCPYQLEHLMKAQGESE